MLLPSPPWGGNFTIQYYPTHNTRTQMPPKANSWTFIVPFSSRFWSKPSPIPLPQNTFPHATHNDQPKLQRTIHPASQDTSSSNSERNTSLQNQQKPLLQKKPHMPLKMSDKNCNKPFIHKPHQAPTYRETPNQTSRSLTQRIIPMPFSIAGSSCRPKVSQLQKLCCMYRNLAAILGGLATIILTLGWRQFASSLSVLCLKLSVRLFCFLYSRLLSVPGQQEAWQPQVSTASFHQASPSPDIELLLLLFVWCL